MKAVLGSASAVLGATVDYPADETLDSLFQAQAQRVPHATALIDKGQPVTYAQLNQRCVELARHFAARGVLAGDTIAICLDRSADMVAAMLAAMRLGAAYVPLDPSNPVARLTYVILDSQARLVLTSKAIQDRLELPGSTLVEDMSASAAMALPDLPVGATNPQGVAYVAYTSGSTGQPKGVMGSHRATVNRFAWMWRTFPFGPDEVMCQKTSISFVDSVWEIFGPLLEGVPQVILDKDTAMDPARLLIQMAQHRISRLLLVPSLLRAILDSGLDMPARVPSLRMLFVSGEKLPGTLARDFLAAAPGLPLVNLYGSSEVTADVTFEVIISAQGDEVPIGLPIDNVRLYILNQHLRPVPRGQTGLLYVGGDALAVGYLHRPDLTAERFVPDPFSDATDARMFATGDRVRQRADGRLMYEGRADQQVKIRGNRVELGEVEAALAALPDIAQAVVLAKTAGTVDVSLVAFVTAPVGAPPDSATLRRGLALTLPDYMIPAEFQALGELPLNTSGKIDRLALAKLPSVRAETAPLRRLPLTDAERDIHRLWTQILKSDDIGVDDDFFELGGHSLLAVKLFIGLRKTYGVDLPISTLFAHPTIRSLAEAVTMQPKPESQIPYNGAPEDSPWDTSVVISQGPLDGSNALFIVGGVGGNVNNLQELGRAMDQHRRVVGLQTRGVLGHRMHDSIERMATEHIEHIRRHQPDGPYLLAGYSGGALTAFEIARQFEVMQQKVQFLGILDEIAPVDMQLRKSTFGQRLAYEARNFAKYGAGAFLSRLRPRVQDKLYSALNALSKPDPERFRLTTLAKSWLKIAETYRPGPYRGEIWLLMTPPEDRKGQEVVALDAYRGWGRIVKGQHHLSVLDANHLGMLTGRNALKVADWLEANIAATNRSGP